MPKSKSDLIAEAQTKGIQLEGNETVAKLNELLQTFNATPMEDQPEVAPEGEAPSELTAPELPEAASPAPEPRELSEFADSIPATGKFEVVAIGDQARVYNKQGQAVSPAMPIAQANDLAYSHSRRDPESH
jgi:hypothetical protein